MQLERSYFLLLSLFTYLFYYANSAPTPTPCSDFKNLPLPSNLGPGSTLSLIIPRDSVTIQAVPGSSWSATLYANSSRIKYLSFSTPNIYYNTTYIELVDTSPLAPGFYPTSDKGAGVSVNPTPFGVLMLVSLLVASILGLRLSWIHIILIGVVLPILVLSTPVSYWCEQGTLVITYPMGSQILVNGLRVPTCHTAVGGSIGPVQQPQLVQVVSYLDTFWFTSPVVIDLDMDPNCTTGCNEVIVCGYRCSVYDSTLKLIPCSGKSCSNGHLSVSSSRVYAPHVVADIDNNGKYDLCAGSGTTVYCWEWNKEDRTFENKPGFPFSLSNIKKSSEIRGMAVEDVDRNGMMTVFVSTTDSAIQLFAILPFGAIRPGWPRYNTDGPPFGDGDPSNKKPGRNLIGHYRYGSYGLNVGIGNMDDDIFPEIINSYDDHQIQAFKNTGIALNCAGYYSNPNYDGYPVTWGQATARWTNKTTDDSFWHGNARYCYPYVGGEDDPCNGDGGTPCVPGGDAWLQFTESPTSVMDIDGDGKNEVISLPNSERGFNKDCTYISQYRTLFVLSGAYGNSGDPNSTASATSCLRHTNFDKEMPPVGDNITCHSCQLGSCSCRKDIYYPPDGVPAVAFGNILGNDNLEMVFGFEDGSITCYDYTGTKQWAFNFANQVNIDNQVYAISCSEPVLADLNGDGIPEVIFTTFGYPEEKMKNEYLMILNNTGQLLYSIDMNSNVTNPKESFNGNGNGAAGAPTVADVDGDGDLEILTHTFDGRLLMFTVPNSSPNCLIWQTARGGYLRKGQPDIPYSY